MIDSVKLNYGIFFPKFDVLVFFNVREHGGIEVIVTVNNGVCVKFAVGYRVAVIDKRSSAALVAAVEAAP